MLRGRIVAVGTFVILLLARANNIQSFRCKARPLRPRKRPQRSISRTFYANNRWLRQPGPWPGAGAGWLAAWLPACLPACVRACLAGWLAGCLPACLPACLTAHGFVVGLPAHHDAASISRHGVSSSSSCGPARPGTRKWTVSKNREPPEQQRPVVSGVQVSGVKRKGRKAPCVRRECASLRGDKRGAWPTRSVPQRLSMLLEDPAATRTARQ